MAKRQPTFIGIGVQKSASTWVHRILLDHPQAYVSDPKELDFFTYYYDRGYQWYARYFEPASNRLAIGEISPSYFHNPLAATRAYRYNSDFQVIVTLRDPVERAYSNHLHEVSTGHYKSADMSFEAGLENNPMYIEQSRYAKHLKPWFDQFSRDKILVLLQEEVEDKPHDMAKCVYDFLTINNAHVSDFTKRRVNESQQSKCALIDLMLKRLSLAGHHIGMGKVIEKIKKNPLISAARQANVRSLRQVVPPMKTTTRRYLQTLLADEVRDTAALLGRESLPWATWQALQEKALSNESLQRLG